MNHAVLVRTERARLGVTRSLTALVKRCVRATLAELGVDIPCEVDLLYTDEQGIRALNREHRDKDAPTDVLSFPAVTLAPGEKPTTDMTDPETGRVALGDIALSLPAARAQAETYSHSYERELGFLTVHATLHLMGYDHERGRQEEIRMNELTESVLATLGLTRGIEV
ncbi:MAG: rRNA maturation RNase YbeY [Oscillospiraceae bacterium]|jgi:probable rRNA maturation factor|nr:rRNA maturation RNase YbeY [Oscillospiraceae bacterium]